MLNSLSTAVSGLEVFQQDMDVIGNNIANSNTAGFKAATVDLGNSFSNTLLAATNSATDPTSSQVGTGVAIDAINTNWSNGALSQTNNNTDLGINGNGFFLVNDPTSGNTYATQDGSFQVNSSGELVDSNGYLLQGFACTGQPNSTTTPPTAATFDTTKLTGITVGANSQFSVDQQGIVSVTQNGTQTVIGQLGMQSFTNPSALVSIGGNLYSNLGAAGGLTNASGVAATTAGAAGTSLASTSIDQGYLELSNVDLSNEMANLIVAQRGFEANSKIVTASDELLQTVVNMTH